MIATAPALRTDHEPVTFDTLLAEQLRRAPWLALSMATHAVVLLLLWLLMPAPAPRPESAAVAFAAAPDTPPLPPVPILPPPPIEVQPPMATPTLAEPMQVPTDATDAIDAFDAMPDAIAGVDSAFDAPFGNAAVGIGGNAGSRGHGTRHGNRKGHPPGSAQPQILRALRWLVAHQDDDGHWDCDGFMKHDRAGVPCDGAGNGVHDVGATGLALLAFLGDGSTLRQGEFQEPLRRGVQWLRHQQEDNGRFGAAAASDFIYDHAIAAYAMCEACGLSDYRVLREPAERGLAYLSLHRNPYGAWRYQPRDGDADTSVTGWCLIALASGKSLGLTVDESALRDGMRLLDQCTGADGRTGYLRSGDGSSRRQGDHAQRFPRERGEALTAVAQFCRYFVGHDATAEPRMATAQAVLAARPPMWDRQSGSIDPYYWYYGTHAMYQAGGTAWTQWQKHLGTAVVATQRTDGNFAGSWDPIGVWDDDGGRVGSTALLALTLEANYRYTRLVR